LAARETAVKDVTHLSKILEMVVIAEVTDMPFVVADYTVKKEVAVLEASCVYRDYYDSLVKTTVVGTEQLGGSSNATDNNVRIAH